MRFSSISGVWPTRSSSDSAVTRLRATGHCWEEDHGVAILHRRLEAVERAHVLALDVDVHERRDVVVLDELRPQPGEARDQVVEQLAHRCAGRGHLALAARLRTERRGNSNGLHACAGLPWQNST